MLRVSERGQHSFTKLQQFKSQRVLHPVCFHLPLYKRVSKSLRIFRIFIDHSGRFYVVLSRGRRLPEKKRDNYGMKNRPSPRSLLIKHPLYLSLYPLRVREENTVHTTIQWREIREIRVPRRWNVDLASVQGK